MDASKIDTWEKIESLPPKQKEIVWDLNILAEDILHYEELEQIFLNDEWMSEEARKTELKEVSRKISKAYKKLHELEKQLEEEERKANSLN